MLSVERVELVYNRKEVAHPVFVSKIRFFTCLSKTIWQQLYHPFVAPRDSGVVLSHLFSASHRLRISHTVLRKWNISILFAPLLIEWRKVKVTTSTGGNKAVNFTLEEKHSQWRSRKGIWQFDMQHLFRCHILRPTVFLRDEFHSLPLRQLVKFPRGEFWIGYKAHLRKKKKKKGRSTNESIFFSHNISN